MLKITPKLTAEIRAIWKNPLYSNAIYLMIGNVAAALLGFLYWAVAAHFYSAAEVGLASAAIAAMTMLGTFSHLGLGVGLVRFLPGADQEQKFRMMNFSLTIAVITSVIVAVTFVLGINIWSPDLIQLRQNGVYFLLFVLFVTATAMASINDCMFIAQRYAGYSTIRMLTFSLLKLVLAVVFAYVLKSYGILNSWGVGLILSLLLALFFLQPRLSRGYRPLPNFAWRKTIEIMRYSIINNISGMLWLLPGWVLPLYVLSRLGAEANAYFYVAWQISVTISMVSQAAATSLFAEGSHEGKDFGSKAFKTLFLLFLILVPIVLLVLLFSDVILKLFGSDYAENSTGLMRLLILGQIPLAVNLVYFSALRVRKKLKVLVVLSLAMVVIALGVSFYLLPRMGIVAAGIGWLSGQTAIALWCGTQAGWGAPFIKRLIGILFRRRPAVNGK